MQLLFMKTTLRWLLPISAAALTGLVIASTTKNSERPDRGSPPTQAPPWEMRDVEGKLLKSPDLKGKVVILDFWATWCGPCRLEIPDLVKLHKQYRSQGLVVIGASLDDGSAVVKSFMKQFNIGYPVAMADEKIQRAFGGIEAIPTTYIIDREGGIVHKHVGYTDRAQFEREIRPLLKP
ncbi:MAG: TlpA family protein disulfide reductase [Verrucomicrobia bacterium]|nr:TlpA family protein disulfide reductase [Verrucomicrobiota bacterium]